MQICALLAVRNEQQYVRHCIQHLAEQGLFVAVIDNESNDATPRILDAMSPHIVVHRECYEYPGFFDLEGLLTVKQRLACTLDFDWFMHVDVDEIPEAPLPFRTLAEAVAHADASGYNTINFDEFLFVPDSEEVPCNYDYQAKQRHYYYFAPSTHRLLRLWRKNAGIDLITSAGHSLGFQERRIFPKNFILRHYIALSRRQLIEKYMNRVFPDRALARGWHANRQGVGKSPLTFPKTSELHKYTDDGIWDTSRPRKTHFFDPRHEKWH